ncbi:hypothetical protein GCM10023322_44910 [Rugosimonospora acidiphila]|uniref:Periplasmic binding protein domain-containing protein n=1 Tax=Rugosimonospora acidiphila TaxID=556531 RepID=A0ABP9S2G6_9ACTN
MAVGAAALLLAAGCSSSSSSASSGGSADSGVSASSGVAYATAQIAKYSVDPAKLAAPGPAIKGARAALQGKKIYYIPLLQSIPNFNIIGQGFAAGAKALGASTTVCDGGANPTSVSNCINQAINTDAAAIVICGFPTSFAPTALASAKSHNVPVLVMGEEGGLGDDQMSYLPNQQTMQEALAADTIIKQSNGAAHVIIAEADDNSQSIGWVQNGAVPEFKKYCPKCDVTVMPFNSTKLQTDVPPQVSTELLQHPGTDYILSEFDTYIPAILQGVQSSHATGIKITGTTGILSGLQRMKAGQLETADVGSNFYEYGWLGTDQLARMMTKNPPTEHPMGIKVFTPDNIKGLNLTTQDQNDGSWFGSSAEWKTTLTQLWQ